ncbi:MAG TPA: proton-conducting transporter membrane subunit [bacterium]|nr:proton-conducting transporter membrane subunit [bacterium]
MNLIIMPVIIYLGSAFVIPLLFRKDEKWAGFTASIFTFLALLVSLLLGMHILSEGRLIAFAGGWKEPLGIALMVDPLSAVFLIVTNLVAFLIVVYAITYMKKYTGTVHFYVLFMLMLAGMNGVLISMDIWNLFVFFEIASLASYILVAFGLRAEEMEAALKYTVMGFLASTFILFAMALVYGLTGTLNIPDFMNAVAGLPHTHMWFIVGLFISGFGLKMALVPFHTWLPDAHSMAPAPVSALLSGLFIKVIGFYCIIRLAANVFGEIYQIKTVLIILGVVTMVLGGIMAYGQKNIKRLFAYSSISQIGYCAIALGIGGYLGYLGALMHFIGHAFSKSLLFLNIGAIEYVKGTTESEDLKGINDQMPYTTLLSNTGMLGIAGIPPMGNFWSKLIIILAAVRAGYTGVAVLCILVAVLTLGYFLKLMRTVYYSKPEMKAEKKEAPLAMLVPMIALGFMVFFAGILLLPAIRTVTLDRAVNVMENFSYKTLHIPAQHDNAQLND